MSHPQCCIRVGVARQQTDLACVVHDRLFVSILTSYYFMISSQLTPKQVVYESNFDLGSLDSDVSHGKGGSWHW